MAESRGRGFLFNEVEIKTPGRSGFDMSFENRLSFNMGDLIPVSCQECLPKDSFVGNPQFFARFAPMLAPIMHKVDLFHYTFFVPNRLLWDSWQDFISPGDGKKTMKSLSDGSYVAPIKPFIDLKHLSDFSNTTLFPINLRDKLLGVGSLADYLGCLGQTATYHTTHQWTKNRYADALPFRAYQLIWDEFFRDQNVTESLDIKKTDGDQAPSIYLDEGIKLLTLRKKAWEHDYFTSALPEPQRGPDVYLPLGDSAPLKFDASKNQGIYNADGTLDDSGKNLVVGNLGSFAAQDTSTTPVTTNLVKLDVSKTHSVDLTAATSATINTLRQAFRLQEFLEKSARVGGRYIETILAHFGVNVPDSRLQRPEFISAGRVPVQVSATTADAASNVTDGTNTWLNVQGTQTGNAMSSGSDKWSYTCLEHGFLITLVCVLPRTAYFQGCKRMFFTRKTYLDYAWPSFAHLGEQEVWQKELFCNGATDEDKTVFGYQSRYADYKYNGDEVHGEFRTNLDFWHMARKFDSAPLLNESFIEANPTTRIFAVTDESVHHIYLDVWYDLYKESALPLYGTPTL